MSNEPSCASCHGTGEMVTESGPADCPDCGGAGFLPSSSVLVDWRASDIERAVAGGAHVEAADVRWLLAQVRIARTALTEIVALAHDVHDSDAIAMRIRVTANRALGAHEPERNRGTRVSRG
jgi:hypothetical protein